MDSLDSLGSIVNRLEEPTSMRMPASVRAWTPFGSWPAGARRYGWGAPALILDVELPDGGQLTTPVPPQFQGFAARLAHLLPPRPQMKHCQLV
jgi:hypothetical protein